MAEGLERELAGLTVEHVHVAQVVSIALDQTRRRDERDEPAVGAETSGSFRKWLAVAFPLHDRLGRSRGCRFDLWVSTTPGARDLQLYQKPGLDRPAGFPMWAHRTKTAGRRAPHETAPQNDT